MRAITELIDYLTARGALSADQLAGLRREGFIDPPDEPAADEPPPVDNEPTVSGGPRDGRRRVGRPAVGADAAALAVRLAAGTAGWPTALAGLVRLAGRLGSAGGWPAAAVRVRTADPDAVSAALGDLLRDDPQSWPAVWAAVRAVGGVAAGDGKGRVTTAFRALLAARDVGHMLKHNWLLKHAPVRDVFNARQARRALLAAVGRVAVEDPVLVARCHRTAFDPLGYAAGVLAHTARVRRTGATAGAAPVRLPADDPVVAEAWECAAAMAPDDTAWLLARWDGLPDARPSHPRNGPYTCLLTLQHLADLDIALGREWSSLTDHARAISIGHYRCNYPAGIIAIVYHNRRFHNRNAVEAIVGSVCTRLTAAARSIALPLRSPDVAHALDPQALAVAWLVTASWSPTKYDRWNWKFCSEDYHHLSCLPLTTERCRLLIERGIVSPELVAAAGDLRATSHADHAKLLCPADWHP